MKAKSLPIITCISCLVLLSCSGPSDEPLAVIVVPKTEWISPGGRFEADLYAVRNLGTAKPRIEWSAEDTSARVEVLEDGGVHYSTTVYNWGPNEVSGSLVATVNGDERRIPFTKRFEVSPFMAHLSISSPYVVRGIPNELDYGVVGYPAHKVILYATNGEIKLEGGKCLLLPGANDSCQVWASVTTNDGKRIETPKQTFLVIDKR
jgi:hypothetical protein